MSYHKVCEAVAGGWLRFEHMPGDQNPADIFTKSLPWATLRLFVEKNLRQKYQQKLRWDYTFLENKERLMNLYKIDPKDQVSDLEILEKEIGFSKLIWHLAKSQKLIVGHNMLTDIMQIMRQFFSSPLPSKFEDFKGTTSFTSPLT